MTDLIVSKLSSNTSEVAPYRVYWEGWERREEKEGREGREEREKKEMRERTWIDMWERAFNKRRQKRRQMRMLGHKWIYWQSTQAKRVCALLIEIGTTTEPKHKTNDIDATHARWLWGCICHEHKIELLCHYLLSWELNSDMTDVSLPTKGRVSVSRWNIYCAEKGLQQICVTWYSPSANTPCFRTCLWLDSMRAIVAEWHALYWEIYT